MLILLAGLARAAQPLPAVVIEVPVAGGPPAFQCKEAIAEAEAYRKVRPPPVLPTQPVREPIPKPTRPSTGTPDDGISGRPRLKLSAAGLAASELPGRVPDEIPLQPLEGRPEDLARIGTLLDQARTRRVRFTVFGASHTGADLFTGQLRRVLQTRYGDLGHGFVFPAALYQGDRGQDINLCRTEGWRSDWPGKKGGREDGLYGFGASLSSADPADFGWLETTVDNPQGRAVSRYEIFSLGEPNGGTLQVKVDDAPVEEISHVRGEVKILRHRVQVPDGPHRLVLSPKGDGEVRLFGVSAEREGPGIIVDAIGIRGRTASSWLRWDEEISSRAIASLAPDLVALAYGTNEANDGSLTPERYAEELRAVLTRVRLAAPDAACLLIGPTDRGKRVARDTFVVWDRTAWVAQVQRQVGPEFGCAFWDWQQAMGGPGSMIAWSMLSPALGSSDLIHLSGAGYVWSADRLLMAMEQAGGLPPP
jgi:lysophospholipase L1-like esterase